MRVESSRDVYASAESAVVFLARAEWEEKQWPRCRRNISRLAEISFCALEWLRATDIYARSITHLGRILGEGIFFLLACLPTIYKCK